MSFSIGLGGCGHWLVVPGINPFGKERKSYLRLAAGIAGGPYLAAVAGDRPARCPTCPCPWSPTRLPWGPAPTKH